ncbi:MAG: VWA domain-containing protein [Candidatus Magnetomorum sp.]|nr:VWA domain-containing protein [Candidatus Magnetomorum sp.]
MNKEPLEELEWADPDLSRSLKSIIFNQNPPMDRNMRQTIVDTILWGMTIEIDLGYSIFKGYEKIIPSQQIHLISQFHQKIRSYAKWGASLGILVADLLPTVLLAQDAELTDQFYQTLNKLQDIGLYILPRPFQSFNRVLASGDCAGALQMLRLFEEAFAKHLDFHQSKNLTQFLPSLCESLSIKHRAFQLHQLIRVVRMDIEWLYACETGLKNGLHSLTPSALSEFIETGIQKYHLKKDKGALYFAIESEVSRNVYEKLQTSISLECVQNKLIQYLHARIGTYVKIRPLSQLKKIRIPSDDCVLNNGQCIYLPDIIGRCPEKNFNRSLYKHLVRWEAGHIEWGTYDFDLEKFLDRYSDISPSVFDSQGSDMVRFLNYFSRHILAENLFTLFEHSRIRWCLQRHYPGIIRKTLPVLQECLIHDNTNNHSFDHSPFQMLYNRLALDMTTATHQSPVLYQHKLDVIIQKSTYMLDDRYASVETSARLVWMYYSDISEMIQHATATAFIQTPFDRHIRVDLAEESTGKWDKAAQRLYLSLKNKKIKVYKSDIRKQLIRQQGQLTVENIQQFIVHGKTGNTLDEQGLIRLISQDNDIEVISETDDMGMAFKYHEWDTDLGSYKLNYTRVIQKEFMQEFNEKYEQSLVNHSGLLRHIRRRFEMLRPEGHKILRRWLEGDDFDYRQLLQYGIDRKIHKTPSERLYTKRVKEYRDVAVFLLVDLSRSTANCLPNTEKSVLDIERDAIVLFCEALKRCGDPFAIAGFSSTGRHAVSYYVIKHINEPLTNTVKNKIGNMSPCRSTRMGAAIRHSNFLLEKVAAKIRLLIVLSDGFPNDTGYKRDYAIKDTRKAVNESRSKGIYVHGITVNLSSNARLDDLYGKGNHHVLSDVTELPDRLPTIYHTLTKSC